MKIQYNKKKLISLLEENSLIFIFCSNHLNINFFNINNIKNFKFKNILLKCYNKTLFNGVILLLYGNSLNKHLNDLKNIIGIFYLNSKKNLCLFTFKKYLTIIKYLNLIYKYKSFLNIINGPLFWFLIKFKKLF